jgi:ubiquinone/menaquinone biosynthesis C-methylase UbiE
MIGPPMLPRNDGARDSAEVTAANRRFYDQVATVYEEVDSRRHGDVDHTWLDAVLERVQALAAKATGRPAATLELLDAGAGSGFLALRAQRLFPHLTLVDVSRAMLDRIPLPAARKLLGDCNDLPLDPATVDVVGAFATLHHLFEPVRFFREAHRVLRPGGVLYTDHDLEAEFVARFRAPLRIYRHFCDHGHGYLERCPAADARDYALSEFHGDRGLGGRRLAQDLGDAGFEVREETYHWEGMGGFDRALRATGLRGALSRRGLAPIIRLVAVKR